MTDFVQASETIHYCTSRLLFSLQISARVARFPHFRFGLPVIALHNRKLHSLHGAMAHIYWMVNGWLMDGIYMVYMFYNIWLMVWNMTFMTFPSYWEWKIILTDELFHIFQRGRALSHQADKNHQSSYTIINHGLAMLNLR